MCLDIPIMNSLPLICRTSTPRVTSPYRSSIVGGTCVIMPDSLGILLVLCTVLPSIEAFAGPQMIFAIFMCLLSIPHSWMDPLSKASPKSTSDGRHKHFWMYLACSARLESIGEKLPFSSATVVKNMLVASLLSSISSR